MNGLQMLTIRQVKDFKAAMDNGHKTASITIQHGTQKWGKGASENGIYRPRRPENSAYYQCVEDHFEDFEQVYEAGLIA
jgi:hypothetical protein